MSAEPPAATWTEDAHTRRNRAANPRAWNFPRDLSLQDSFSHTHSGHPSSTAHGNHPLDLCFKKLSIVTCGLAHQFVMRTYFHEAALMQNYYLICLKNRRKPVRNQNRCPTCGERVKGALNCFFCFAIKGARGFIKN